MRFREYHGRTSVTRVGLCACDALRSPPMQNQTIRVSSRLRTTVAKVMAVCAIGLVTAAQGGPQPTRDVPAFLAEKLAKKLRGGPADGLQPFTAAAEAQEYFVMKRAAAGEAALPFERYVAALRHMDSMPQYASAS